MKFGYHHISFQYEKDSPIFESVKKCAQLVEEGGFVWFSFMDHLWQIPDNGYLDEEFFDCYTFLPAIAAVTEKMELGALVTCVHFRNPTLLGRMIATLDHISQGRAVLGIGAGWYEDEFKAYGFDFPNSAERIHRLEDAIKLIKEMWTQESPVTYHGEYYEIENLILEPKPVQKPHPPILVGGGGRQLLRVVAKLADRYNIPNLSPEEYSKKLDVIAQHCKVVGRDYSKIQKTVVNPVIIRETSEKAHECYENLQSMTESGPTSRDKYRGLIGTSKEVVNQLEKFREMGVELFIVKSPKNDRDTVIEFINNVIPCF